MNREHNLEDFSPKRLTEEQQAKISEITAYLTGKASSNFKKEVSPSSDDFDFEDSFESTSSSSKDDDSDDDFFSDF